MPSNFIGTFPSESRGSDVKDKRRYFLYDVCDCWHKLRLLPNVYSEVLNNLVV